MSYRTKIDKETEEINGIRYTKTEFVMEVLDEIENHVNDLETQVETIYDKSHNAYLNVKELSSDLF